MKKKIIFLLLLACSFDPVFSQNNDLMQQIRTSAMANILSFQIQNRGINNMVLTQQIGDQNRNSINQQTDAGSGFGNQVYNIQQGISNEMTIGQIGKDNLLLSYQLGYSTTLESRLQQGNLLGFGLAIGNILENTSIQLLVSGERNKQIVNQDGSNNAVMAVQEGNDNTISAGQKGYNNYLLILQNGKSNTVSGYQQENFSATNLFDTIIQDGVSLSLSATDVSKSKLNGNSFMQSGVNLSLEVNNEFTNTLGGIEIKQMGRNMKVVVDQSYFIK
jgi:hypothetical protein